MRLQGKSAVITGAGAGIGRAASLAFAREGAALLCVDLSAATGEETAALVRQAGGTAHFLAADAADEDDVRRIVATAEEQLGGLDIFFANAGVVPGGTVLDTGVEEWDRCMAINVRSVYLACRYSIPLMRARGGGAIVCTASVAGLCGVKNRAVYSASKAAVAGLVKSVAIDFITDGIRINAICPGTVDTPSLQGRLEATGNYEQAYREFVARQPMGRLGKAEEIAALAVYLASDESGYMTGQALMIDGGLSL